MSFFSSDSMDKWGDKLASFVSVASDKVKEAATNTLSKETPLEKNLREATSDKNWGCSTTVLSEIARASFDYKNYFVIMKAVTDGLHEAPRKWRRTFKTLTLIDYLLKNGSQSFPDDLREKRPRLLALTDFHFTEEGRDKGSGVREKAKNICQLLDDPKLLKTEQKIARQNRNKFVGIGGRGERTGPGYTYSADYRSGGSFRSGGDDNDDSNNHHNGSGSSGVSSGVTSRYDPPVEKLRTKEREAQAEIQRDKERERERAERDRERARKEREREKEKTRARRRDSNDDIKSSSSYSSWDSSNDGDSRHSSESRSRTPSSRSSSRSHSESSSSRSSDSSVGGRRDEDSVHSGRRGGGRRPARSSKAASDKKKRATPHGRNAKKSSKFDTSFDPSAAGPAAGVANTNADLLDISSPSHSGGDGLFGSSDTWTGFQAAPTTLPTSGSSSSVAPPFDPFASFHPFTLQQPHQTQKNVSPSMMSVGGSVGGAVMGQQQMMQQGPMSSLSTPSSVGIMGNDQNAFASLNNSMSQMSFGGGPMGKAAAPAQGGQRLMMVTPSQHQQAQSVLHQSFSMGVTPGTQQGMQGMMGRPLTMPNGSVGTTSASRPDPFASFGTVPTPQASRQAVALHTVPAGSPQNRSVAMMMSQPQQQHQQQMPTGNAPNMGGGTILHFDSSLF